MITREGGRETRRRLAVALTGVAIFVVVIALLGMSLFL